MTTKAFVERVSDPLSDRTQRAVMVRGAKDHAASR